MAHNISQKFVVKCIEFSHVEAAYISIYVRLKHTRNEKTVFQQILHIWEYSENINAQLRLHCIHKYLIMLFDFLCNKCICFTIQNFAMNYPHNHTKKVNSFSNFRYMTQNIFCLVFCFQKFDKFGIKTSTDKDN